LLLSKTFNNNNSDNNNNNYQTYNNKYVLKAFYDNAIVFSHCFIKGTCYHANALDPHFAHKIIGQFEGTLPSPGLSFLSFIQPPSTGVDYATKSPTILIQFQSNVVGQLDEISLINLKHNIKQFQVDLFDFNNNLLLSQQTNDKENSIKLLPASTNNSLLVSIIQVTVLRTTDERPARGIILSITGCFSTFPQISTTTTTTIAPTTTQSTTRKPRKSSSNFLLLIIFIFRYLRSSRIDD
jgi:hypothetical protein